MDEDKIPDQLKCPICLEIFVQEIFQCTNGHSICGACSSKMNQCPQCRASYIDGKVRNRSMEEFLDTMNVIISCPNKIYGCDVKLCRKNYEAHAADCSYDPQCFRFCEQLGFKCEYRLNTCATVKAINHFRECHGLIIRESEYAAIQLTGFKSAAEDILTKSFAPIPGGGRSEGKQENANAKKFWNIFVLDFDSDFKRGNNGPAFLILCQINPEDKTFSCVCLFMPGKKQSEPPKFQVEYKIKKHTTVKEVKSLQWIMPVDNVLDSKASVPLFPMRIPLVQLLQHYTCRDDGCLKIKVSVFRKRPSLHGDNTAPWAPTYLTRPENSSSIGMGNLSSSFGSGYSFAAGVFASSPQNRSSSSLSVIPFGTIEIPYRVTTAPEAATAGSHVPLIRCISAMPEYETKSVEELRLEDYQLFVEGKWRPK